MTVPVLRFRRDESITPVPGDGVFITSERGASKRLHGTAVSAAFPLLDGTLSRAQVVDRLGAVLGERAAHHAVEALLNSGHVIEADPGIDSARAGYFEQLGFDADDAVRRLDAATLDVLALGRAGELDIDAALRGTGLPVTRHRELREVPESARFLLVVTDDYQRAELRSINREACRRGLPWMPVRPYGESAWFGPMVTPGETACFECLHVRLHSKNLSQSYFRQRGALRGDPVPTALGLASGTTAALALAAHAVAVRLARPAEVPTEDARRAGDVTTVDLGTLRSVRHRLDPRPQCAVCGDSTLQTDRMAAPVRLQSRAAVTTGDGGHRAMSPEDFTARYRHFVSPITGPVSHLTEMPRHGEDLFVYTAGQNFAVPMRGLADLRAGLRSLSCGKGKSRAQAEASALGEAIERYSGLFHGDEPRVLARWSELGPDRAVHPNTLHHFSEAQFRNRDDWNARPSHFHWVGDQLDPDAQIEWTPVYSLTRERHILVPTSALFYAFQPEASPFNASSNSNGCAAGSSLEDAVLQGFMELVERDATAIWWYNRLRRRRIDLDSFDDPYVSAWREQYRRLGREAWVLDITTDLGIPTVVAVSRRTDKPAQDILFALGSHFDLGIAVGRALSEMNQFLSPVADMPSDGTGSYRFDDVAQVEFWKTATIEDNPFLAPDDSLQPVRSGDYEDLSTGDLAADVRTAQRIVEEAGMEMLVLDQTRVDIGLPVVRVIVPGLRHFWPRFAPGRLYEVPVRRGWLDSPTPEDELNPIGIFI